MIAHTMNAFKQISQLGRSPKREQPCRHALIGLCLYRPDSKANPCRVNNG